MKLREENRKYTETLNKYEEVKEEVRLLKSNTLDLSRLLEQRKQDEQALKRKVASFHSVPITSDDWDVNDVLLSSHPIPLLHQYAASGKELDDDSEIRQLLSFVHSHFPAFLEEIDRRGINLKQSQRLVCVLVNLCFLPSEICILLNMSSSSLSNMRKRLLQRLFDEEGNASVFDDRIRSLRPPYRQK